MMLSVVLTSCGSLTPKETNPPASEGESTIYGDIVTTEAIQTTEQTETAEQSELSYQVVYSDAIGFKNPEYNFALFANREELSKLDNLDSQLYEKYDDEWFDKHSFIFIELRRGSCCFGEFNRLEWDDGCLTVYIDRIDNDDRAYYQEKGKDYEAPYDTGAHHNLDACMSNFFIEFDRNGAEMSELIDKVIYKFRDYPSPSWSEIEIPLREPEPPVLELESIPFRAAYIRAQKDSYSHYEDSKGTYREWGNKAAISVGVDLFDQAFGLNGLIDAFTFVPELRAEMKNAGPFVYASVGINPSYRCEVQRVSIEGTTLKLYADAVYEDWDKLTEAQQAAIKADSRGCELGLDTHKQEIILGFETAYGGEYLELLKTNENCVVVVRDAQTDQTTELELKYFTKLQEVPL